MTRKQREALVRARTALDRATDAFAAVAPASWQFNVETTVGGHLCTTTHGLLNGMREAAEACDQLLAAELERT